MTCFFDCLYYTVNLHLQSMYCNNIPLPFFLSFRNAQNVFSKGGGESLAKSCDVPFSGKKYCTLLLTSVTAQEGG